MMKSRATTHTTCRPGCFPVIRTTKIDQVSDNNDPSQVAFHISYNTERLAKKPGQTSVEEQGPLFYSHVGLKELYQLIGDILKSSD